jgi:hypothetical protein
MLQYNIMKTSIYINRSHSVFGFQGFSPNIPTTHYGTSNSLIQVVHVIKFCDHEKIDLDILFCKIFSLLDYENNCVLNAVCLSICTYVFMYVCAGR